MNASIQRGDRIRLTRERIDGTHSRSEWVGTVESVGRWGFALAIDGSTVLHNGEELSTSARSHFAWHPGPAYKQTIDRLPTGRHLNTTGEAAAKGARTMASETDRALYRAAYHAGRSARIAGEPRTVCPYPFDYARHWLDGWDDADMDLRSEGADIVED